MAEKVTTTLVDDIDGSAATERVSFALDGKSYEIDLNKRNAAKLRKAMQPFIDAGRKAGGTTARRNGKGAAARDFDIEALRAWAKKKRIALPQRGRIPGAIVERYKADGGR